MSRFAPIHISFALAHLVSPDPADYLGRAYYESRAGKQTREWLFEEGLIDAFGAPTARLRAWVEHLCAQPLPEMVWTVPQEQTP